MINLSLSDIAKQVNGTLSGDDLVISGVSTDTRAIAQNDVFIALV
jgi:UDP-N-acetylmuramoyl-tripeptide--D-alanyl-D-alanine ligase